ncbi:MAG: CPBP family glutamic-type intramembrane protease [Brumimicrobium sp.]
MKRKIKLYIISLATLLGFPFIGYLILYFFEDYSFLQFFQLLEWEQFGNAINLIGLEFGFIYGFIILFISQAPIFREFSLPQTKMLKSLNLNFFDAVFVAFCAGFGEEILFRVVIQSFLGPWVTTFIFIAIHGYFSLRYFKKNILGLSLFPFILLISFGYVEFGFWFVVAAHFSYDLLMFLAVIYSDESS